MGMAVVITAVSRRPIIRCVDRDIVLTVFP